MLKSTRSLQLFTMATVAIVASVMTPASSPGRVGPQSGLKSGVRPAVALVAEPFPLTAVRLLDGPFRDAMLVDQAYLLGLDVDRLLHSFRVNAGLPSTARPLGGWEAPEVELRGHSVGHYVSALALMYASTGDIRFKARGDAMVAEFAKIQAALAAHGAGKGYLSAFPEELIDRVEARQRVWAPYYTLHKILAGLLDMYQLCGNQQALDVLVSEVDWVKSRVDRFSRAQQQSMLMTEHGGMKEVLANLYAITGNPEHLRLSRVFDHDVVFEPLARAVDPLDGLHANTQIPKIIGAARDYELSGDPHYRDIALFFWKRVALNRSFANGGHSDDETFFPVDQFREHLGPMTSETCNTYNMLKLSRHLFSWGPSAELMDFYERGLYNHILASQDPATGGMIYYCPLKPGAFKTYSTHDGSFWCCVGTGFENHAKYPDTVYFHSADTLFVNLFIPTELTWAAKGLVVRQETRFPESDSTSLSFKAKTPVHLALKLRYPSWATKGMAVTVNGKEQIVTGTPGSYVTIDRIWATGDTVGLTLPMSLRTESLPGVADRVAVFYGPILLAGDLGKDDLTSERRYGPSAPQLARMKAPVVPAFVSLPGAILSHITAEPARPLVFHTRGLAYPHDVTLVPFWKTQDVRYNVYWQTYSPEQWETQKAGFAAAETRRNAILASVIDTVDVDKAESERRHSFKSEKAPQVDFEGRNGRETQDGWFSYDVKVDPAKAVTLICTYRGSEGRRRTFDVLVDGTKIATENLAYHPTELLDIEYGVPMNLTAGKDKVTITFKPQDGAATGALYEMRVVPGL
jgi:uncharacterized protein